MKKVLLSILEPAHIQKGEVLQRKRTYDYEEGYEDILKSGNYVNNSGFYDPDRKEHVEFVVQMIPETVYYLTYTLSNRTFRVPLEESEIKQYPDLEVVDVGRITPVYGDITADMLQWMWRSQIRNGKPIDIYIPSERMRELLNNWIQNCYVTEKAA